MNYYTSATQRAIDLYGPDRCLEAARMNDEDGEGANTIAQLLGFTDYLTATGARLIDAGRELRRATRELIALDVVDQDTGDLYTVRVTSDDPQHAQLQIRATVPDSCTFWEANVETTGKWISSSEL